MWPQIYEAIQNIHVAQAGLLEARQYHALMQALLRHKQSVQSATIATDAAESYVTLISRLPEPLGEPCNKLLSMMQEQCTAPRATRGSITAALQCAQWLLGDTDKLMELYLECLKVVANTVEEWSMPPEEDVHPPSLFWPEGQLDEAPVALADPPPPEFDAQQRLMTISGVSGPSSLPEIPGLSSALRPGSAMESKVRQAIAEQFQPWEMNASRPSTAQSDMSRPTTAQSSSSRMPEQHAMQQYEQHAMQQYPQEYYHQQHAMQQQAKQRPMTAVGTQPRFDVRDYMSAGGLSDSALNDARSVAATRPATAMRPTNKRHGALPAARLPRATSAQGGNPGTTGRRGLQRAWGGNPSAVSRSSTVRFGPIDEEGGSKNRQTWSTVGSKNPGILAADSKNKVNRGCPWWWCA